MGLFSSKKVISVASTAYNLAGPLQDRQAYLKTTAITGVLTGNGQRSLGNHIVNAQLNGPTFSQRSFFRWSRGNYPIGRMSGFVNQRQPISDTVVASFISVGANESAQIQSAVIDVADVNYWIERHILETRPEMIDQPWSADIPTGSNTATISYPDTTTETVTFTDFNDQATYLYAYYMVSDETNVSYWSYGPTVQNAASRPETVGWIPLTSQQYSENVVLTTTTTTTINGGSPTVESTDETVTYTGLEETLELEVGQPVNPDQPVQFKDVKNIWIRSEYVIVSETTTTTTQENGDTIVVEETVESIEQVWDHKTDVLKDVKMFDLRGDPKLFIYRIGSGNPTLDALNVTTPPVAEFFPVIPMRIDNRSIRHPDFAGQFPIHSKAFKRATGQGFEKVLDDVEDNPQIGDIDYAYLVHGVELNTQERQGREFIYRFLKSLIGVQTYGAAEIQAWQNANAAYAAYLLDLEEWEEDQVNNGPRFGQSRPTAVSRPTPPTSSMEFSTAAGLNYRMRLSWVSIQEGVASGQGKPGAQVGDMWWGANEAIDLANMPLWEGDFRHFWFGGNAMHQNRLYWQDTAGGFRYLEILGLVHDNVVYQNKSVTIQMQEALADPDESGFIIPLHYPTLKAMGIVQANELVSSSRLIVFNSYKVKKVRWYQKTLFRIVITVAIAVGASLIIGPASAGVLGTNAAVGASLGLTGVSAAIAGAVANAIAAALLTHMITAGATAVFGEKYGAIIGAIATLLAFQYMASFQSGAGFSFNWGEIMKVDNLMKLMDVTSKGFQGMTQARINEIGEEMGQLQADHEDGMDEIRKLWAEFGNSGVVLDPLELFTDLQDSAGAEDDGLFIESSNTFLRRTLMTGSDIADVSLGMIENFTEISLILPAPDLGNG